MNSENFSRGAAISSPSQFDPGQLISLNKHNLIETCENALPSQKRMPEPNVVDKNDLSAEPMAGDLDVRLYQTSKCR